MPSSNASRPRARMGRLNRCAAARWGGTVTASASSAALRTRHISQKPCASPDDGYLHGVEGATVAGWLGVFKHSVQRLCQGGGAIVQTVIDSAAQSAPQYRHTAGREGAGFVHTQHRGGSQQCRRRDAAGPYLLARQALRARAQEKSQDDRQLLRPQQHRLGNHVADNRRTLRGLGPGSASGPS